MELGVFHYSGLNHLTDRKQYVSVCGNTSKTLEIKCGVPQGSVLGPL